jgi:1-acyl-sn-glycerol-3-phosphate acyltransferase
MLILSNHQSHLDPMLIGPACPRQLNYLARRTLFDFAPLGWLMSSVGTIPLDRDGVGVGGLKETLRCLKQDKGVLIFPEGTRSRDGQIAPLKPGFSALARRTRVPIVPVAIAGAFEAWPRSSPFPRPGVVHIQFGTPISPAEAEAFDERDLVIEVERRIRACHAEAVSHRNRAMNRS